MVRQVRLAIDLPDDDQEDLVERARAALSGDDYARFLDVLTFGPPETAQDDPGGPAAPGPVLGASFHPCLFLAVLAAQEGGAVLAVEPAYSIGALVVAALVLWALLTALPDRRAGR
jgi:hypothetical protein